MRSRARPRNRLGALEFGDAFVLAEIRSVVQFLQQDELRAGACSLAQPGLDGIEVRRGAAAVVFLQQSGAQCLVHASSPEGSCIVTQCRLPFCQISGRHGT